eukprot:c15791_g1_i1.p1 GENE.c15791_g1_i1~~c15791_g1_i1.p1  ORF type:complete len:340 (+),score=57.15 c15791_g1_i1:90-1109(+)
MAVPHRVVHGAILADQYRFERCLGTGSYAEVWEAIPVQTPNADKPQPAVAVKIMQVRECKLPKSPNGPMDVPLQRIASEILALKLAGSHPNIPTLYRVGQSATHSFLIMQRADKGDMFERMLRCWNERGRGTRAMFETEASVYFAQLLNVVSHLHRKGITHGDIKLENILLTTDPNGSEWDRVLLTDFGFARTRPTPSKARRASLPAKACEDSTSTEGEWYMCSQRHGTIEYSAPEILTAGGSSCTEYDTRKTDAWACGVALYCMLTARLPFDGGSTTQTMSNIMFAESILRFPSDMSAEVKELLRGLLNPNPSVRWTVDRARHHSFVTRSRHHAQTNI